MAGIVILFGDGGSMPNGKFHRQIGAFSGVGFAAWRAQAHFPAHQLLEAIGGGLGGNVGARLPDIIDPPFSPRHRSVGHGLLPVGTVAHHALPALDGLQAYLRAEAERHALCRAQSTSALIELWHWFLEVLCRVASGAAAGFVAGYGSHVALDMLTPAGLPLVA